MKVKVRKRKKNSICQEKQNGVGDIVSSIEKIVGPISNVKYEHSKINAKFFRMYLDLGHTNCIDDKRAIRSTISCISDVFSNYDTYSFHYITAAITERIGKIHIDFMVLYTSEKFDRLLYAFLNSISIEIPLTMIPFNTVVHYRYISEGVICISIPEKDFIFNYKDKIVSDDGYVSFNITNTDIIFIYDSVVKLIIKDSDGRSKFDQFISFTNNPSYGLYKYIKLLSYTKLNEGNSIAYLKILSNDKFDELIRTLKQYGDVRLEKVRRSK